ncbi:MAG: RES family NAD+ phosphorylase [Oceanospirillaceae bacterium]|nr:RES family NAD+ phosphorylase [Oceanospirillaceae bacterium]
MAKILLEIGSLQSCNLNVFRIVETQEIAATTGLVDDLEEQHLLEQLLDKVKPSYREGTEKLHYLISTPFRYPPLKYGSRFGDITMPSYFYASECIETALAECAFYRLVFLHDMSVPFERPIKSGHMTFSVKIQSNAVADLTLVKSKDIATLLKSPNDYILTQQLGKVLIQEKGTKVIKFFSARDKLGINYAIAVPETIKSARPENSVNWICHSTLNKISFITKGGRPISFSIDNFNVDGVLPRFA